MIETVDTYSYHVIETKIINKYKISGGLQFFLFDLYFEEGREL